MKKEQGHRIARVKEGSIAEELELEAGDVLLQINDQVVEDVFDYEFLCRDTYLEVVIRKADGEEWLLEVEKGEEEELGMEFESSLMSDYRSCTNKCIFCFIDQMPPGMRDTLYFKDDDTRLSFLQGNYVTLTNLKDKDIDRIIRYRLGPINISVHATNPELRKKMLHNRFAGELLHKIDRLYEAGIEMNGQIVLCKGINDGAELERSLADLSKYVPVMESLSVVPVGLTRYREGLYPLEPFEKEDACAALEIIEKWQQKFLADYGIRFVHASDEFYIVAERPIPPEEEYEGYIQLENGVGMVRLLLDEVTEALSRLEPDDRQVHVSSVSGLLVAPFLQQISEQIQGRFPNVRLDVHPITNHFFGERITVTGLITGQDLIAQLKGKDLGEKLLIPINMLRSGETVFLDDITVAEVETALQVPVDIVKSSGQALVSAVTGTVVPEDTESYPPYELESL